MVDQGETGRSERPLAGLVRLPPGEPVLTGWASEPRLFQRVDDALSGGRCPHGRLEIETPEVRLVCLIHDSGTYLAGQIEEASWRRLPLREIPARASQLANATCTLIQTDGTLTRMAAVQFCQRPALRSSTRLVDPAQLLQVLSEEGRDAVLAFERGASRTLLYLPGGRPGNVYFGHPREDSGQGDSADRLLAHIFASGATSGTLEVFADLEVVPDADAGAPLAELAEAGMPPPPTTVTVRLAEGRALQQRPFTAPEVVIGRDPQCEIFLDNLAVSRRHARIAWSRGRFLLEDLDSANGTRLNGTPVRSVPLGRADEIEVGKFRISLEEQRAVPGASETLLLATSRGVSQLFLEGHGQSVALDRSAVIGRGRGVDIQAKGWSVRAVHARLDRRGAGLELICFGGATAGVNGRRARRSRLVAGDRLRIGRSEFQVARR